MRTSNHHPFSKTTVLPARCSGDNVYESPAQKGSSGNPIAGSRQTLEGVVAEPNSAKMRLGEELTQLRVAAGKPTSDTLIRQAGARGVKFTRSSLSDWFRGRSVPNNYKAFSLLVELLTNGRASGQLVALYEEAGRESSDRRGTRLSTPGTVPARAPRPADSPKAYRLPSLDMIHYANVPRLNVLLAAHGHPEVRRMPAHSDRPMVEFLDAMESISVRLAKVELPLKLFTPDLNLRTLQQGDLLVFDRTVRTLNGLRPNEIRPLTGDLDVDPLVYIKTGGVRIVMPYDSRYVTTSTAYGDFAAGQAQMFGLCIIKRRGQPKDALHRGKKPKAQYVASPLVLGQTSPHDRDPDLRAPTVIEGFDIDSDSSTWHGPWS